jgi:hypothetical protein
MSLQALPLENLTYGPAFVLAHAEVDVQPAN